MPSPDRSIDQRGFVPMECPICNAPMTHLGYFSWTCDDCGHRCDGELPPRVSVSEEDGAS
jgi:hypothetical protein